MSTPDPDLRGKCESMSKAAVEADPTLRLVRGWYHDPDWGRQEHWWTERPDGTILDPTSGQFPWGGIPHLYEEYQGVFPCGECGADVREGEGYDGCCNEVCFGRMVGLGIRTDGTIYSLDDGLF